MQIQHALNYKHMVFVIRFFIEEIEEFKERKYLMIQQKVVIDTSF